MSSLRKSTKSIRVFIALIVTAVFSLVSIATPVGADEVEYRGTIKVEKFCEPGMDVESVRFLLPDDLFPPDAYFVYGFSYNEDASGKAFFQDDVVSGDKIGSVGTYGMSLAVGRRQPQIYLERTDYTDFAVATCGDGEPPVDTDGDGVSDDVDQCDTQPGPASNNGCPVSVPPVDDEVEASVVTPSGVVANSTRPKFKVKTENAAPNSWVHLRTGGKKYVKRLNENGAVRIKVRRYSNPGKKPVVVTIKKGGEVLERTKSFVIVSN